MNQAIQILDGAAYMCETQNLKIEAFYHGQLITCFISGGDEKALRRLYANHQFDIEEQLEALIQEERFDANGAIQIRVEQFS